MKITKVIQSVKSFQTLLWSRRVELLNSVLKIGQLGINFWMAVSLKTDLKNSRNSATTNTQSAQQTALHQQIGLVTTPPKSSPLSTAQSLSQFGHQGNYYFGSFQPEIIRAILTLYLAITLLHTIHSKIKHIYFETSQKKFKISTTLSIFFIILLAFLDIAVVNDVFILHYDQNLSSFAVNDVYTSGVSPFKMRNKELIQSLDYILNSVLLGYRQTLNQIFTLIRWVSIFFLICSFWSQDLKPLFRGRKNVRPTSTSFEPLIQIHNTSLSPANKLLPESESSQQKFNIGRKKGKSLLQDNRNRQNKKSTMPIQDKQNQNLKIQRNNSISSQSSQPLELIKQSSTQFSQKLQPDVIIKEDPEIQRYSQSQKVLPPDSTEDTSKKDTVMIHQNFLKRGREIRSESQPNSKKNSIVGRDSQSDSTRIISPKKQNLNQDFSQNINGHLFKFSLATPKGLFEFETSSMIEFNKKIDEISTINHWHDFVTLNVRLHFWQDAYKKLKNTQSKNVVKTELVKLISAYSLSLINQQQNFGKTQVDFD